MSTADTKTTDTKTTDTKTHIPRKVEHADTADFQRKVLESDVPVLVDFYADWCGPCRMLAPTLEELARETSDARIVKVDVDRNPELAARYKVGSIPSLAVFAGGEIRAQHVGLADKSELKALLKR
ncbi:MAG: thioredoxin [Planctomycetes bacterium]|nr:thioredoxin [Planctomycetota bacterium]